MNKRNVSHASPAPQLLLTIPQVATALEVGRSTVYELIKHDGLPTVMIRGKMRVPVVSLQHWIAQQEQPS